MAIDTANKRASVIGLSLAFRFLAPTPDGDLSTLADREQMALVYALDAAPPPPASSDGFWIINTRRRRG